MQFKDAAYEILKDSTGPLHYNTITDIALKNGILTTTGLTPHQSMGALLYTDTLKPNSHFRRGDKKGTFALRGAPPSDIEQQIKSINAKVRKTLINRLLKMEPRKFENLVQSLLDEMGLEQTSVTTYSGDGGIDIRGVLNAENLSKINVAVQTKRWKGNVGPKVVRELRGSLKVHEHGIVITPSDFTSSAKVESDEAGKTRISLINGEELVELLIHHQVGVKQEEYTISVLDEEYWTEILGEDVQSPQAVSLIDNQKSERKKHPELPLPIQGKHKGKFFHAELLDVEGNVRYQEKLYKTATAAAKAITVGWKSVNGWDFWRFFDATNQRWITIKHLRD
jgi:restriction system protein